MTIIKIFSLFIWLLAVPFCIGLLPMPYLDKRFRTPGAILSSGYILLFTLLEVAGIPVVVFQAYNGFSTFTGWFTAALLVAALSGAGITYWRGKRGYSLRLEGFSSLKGWGFEGRGTLALFLLLVVFQLYMAYTRASFDGDDAYYGAQALAAQQLDTLYRVNPYTGRGAPLDVRHALALFPIWEAYVGTMCGIHATIFCHSIAPLILIPLTYILYYQAGLALFWKKRQLLPGFMVLIALWQMFGNISLYTTETFFLTRTWQGKSFAGNFVIPAVLWLFLCLFGPEGKKKKGGSGKSGFWVLLGCLNLAGGASSSLAVLLSCLMTGGFGVLFALWEKKFSVLIKAGICCVPGGLYVLLYLALTHGLIGGV